MRRYVFLRVVDLYKTVKFLLAWWKQSGCIDLTCVISKAIKVLGIYFALT